MFENVLCDLKNNFLEQDIYTDASKSEQRVGIAILIDKVIITYINFKINTQSIPPKLTP